MRLCRRSEPPSDVCQQAFAMCTSSWPCSLSCFLPRHQYGSLATYHSIQGTNLANPSSSTGQSFRSGRSRFLTCIASSRVVWLSAGDPLSSCITEILYRARASWPSPSMRDSDMLTSCFKISLQGIISLNGQNYERLVLTKLPRSARGCAEETRHHTWSRKS